MIRIDGFVIDAAISEEHVSESQATDYPVETGSNVTDHIRNAPRQLTVEGIVSDTPLDADVVQARGGFTGGIRQSHDVGGEFTDALPSEAALAKLEEIRLARKPVVVTSSIRTYKSMALLTLTVPRDKETGAALRFTAVFKEVLFVTNARTIVKVAVPRASGKRGRGHKPATTYANALSNPAIVETEDGTRINVVTGEEFHPGPDDTFSNRMSGNPAIVQTQDGTLVNSVTGEEFKPGTAGDLGSSRNSIGTDKEMRAHHWTSSSPPPDPFFGNDVPAVPFNDGGETSPIF